MELYYCQPSGISPPTITLDAFESRHMTVTMRKKKGDLVTITDGLGHVYHCTIGDIKRTVRLNITSMESMLPPKRRIALAIGYIRPNRLEFVLEKGTELGVTDFYLLRSRYSNYKGSNAERYEKYLRQAIKQSLHYYLPRLHLLNNLKDMIESTQDYANRIAAIAPSSPPLTEILKTDSVSSEDVLIAIGPEGGFSLDEITWMDEGGFKMASLGLYRLRAETAAISGIALIILSRTI